MQRLLKSMQRHELCLLLLGNLGARVRAFTDGVTALMANDPLWALDEVGSGL